MVVGLVLSALDEAPPILTWIYKWHWCPSQQDGGASQHLWYRLGWRFSCTQTNHYLLQPSSMRSFMLSSKSKSGSKYDVIKVLTAFAFVLISLSFDSSLDVRLQVYFFGTFMWDMVLCLLILSKSSGVIMPCDKMARCLVRMSCARNCRQTFGVAWD